MPGFHVFVSHNSSDKPTVRALKQLLVIREIRVWLDEDELRPGLTWQDKLEQGIKSSDSVAVCVAADGLGPWEDEEMQAALRLAVTRKLPVIPVLLPGASERVELPMFLGNRTWVDLRSGLVDPGLEKLLWGITGVHPRQSTAKAETASMPERSDSGPRPDEDSSRPHARCPYPGLMAYDWDRDPETARLFFGRETETQDLLERLQMDPAGRFLIVTGASGSGKSSLVKAGLWRALSGSEDGKEEPLPGCRNWAISAMVPNLDGDAFHTLIDSAKPFWAEGRLRPVEWIPRLREDARLEKPEHFSRFLDLLLIAHPTWLLILDQMEELFVPEAKDYSDAFIAFLVKAVTDPRFRVVATLRSDFQPQAIRKPALLEILNKPGASYYVDAPDPLALASMIKGRARAVGLDLEPALTAQLIREAQPETGGLALLAATLQDLYEAGKEEGALSLRLYQDEVGGLKGVLTRRAQRGLAILGREHIEPDAAVRRVFGRLVNVDPNTNASTRKRASLAARHGSAKHEAGSPRQV
ncbi:MAG: toll/interleukin-1 receptor domain-containing protein [Pseudomonadota bacterium]|nr:toll/interleukin-1 receptor domain-containing protein [Pseudomonadota bacterium]